MLSVKAGTIPTTLRLAFPMQLMTAITGLLRMHQQPGHLLLRLNLIITLAISLEAALVRSLVSGMHHLPGAAG